MFVEKQNNEVLKIKDDLKDEIKLTIFGKSGFGDYYTYTTENGYSVIYSLINKFQIKDEMEYDFYIVKIKSFL